MVYDVENCLMWYQYHPINPDKLKVSALKSYSSNHSVQTIAITVFLSAINIQSLLFFNVLINLPESSLK